MRAVGTATPTIPTAFRKSAPLDFHSPYGCSKGTADQYVRDYARMYGLNTVVFRQSCIYGTRQFGVEDQGWIAWFTIARLLGRPITVYGDGRQVRDVLWVDDLVDLYQAAIANMSVARGKVYNAGGGAENVMSLLELLGYLGGSTDDVNFDDWRPGDQRCFIADTSKAKIELGWQARTSPRDGVSQLSAWAKENEATLASVLGVHRQDTQKKAVEQKRLQDAKRNVG